MKRLSRKEKQQVKKVVQSSLTAEERKKRIEAFARLKAIELDLPEWEVLEELLHEWRTQELLESCGNIDLDIDLDELNRLRENRGTER